MSDPSHSNSSRLTVFTACLLFVLIAGTPALVRYLAAGDTGSHLDVTITAGEAGVFQVFYDQGEGFDEKHSSSVPFSTDGPQRISVALPRGTYRRMRLDPTRNPGSVSLARLEIRTDGSRILSLPLSGLRPVHQVVLPDLEAEPLTIRSTGQDPQLLLTFDEPLTLGATTFLSRAALSLGVLALATCLLFGVCRLAAGTASLSTFRLSQTSLVVGLTALLAVSRLPGLWEPLLDWHSFRQTQTALSSYWIAAEGLSLPGYPLPVLGRPWTAPMEFPTYQMLVAVLFRAGLPLDLAARGLAAVSFALSCGVFAAMLRREKYPGSAIGLMVLVAALSPFALVWSRAALIEFLAVLFGLCYVAAAVGMSHRRGVSPLHLFLLCAAGTAASLTKVTSFTVFWPAAALLACLHLYKEIRSSSLSRRLPWTVLGWLCGLFVPLVVAVLWTKSSDAVKSAQETTAWLTSEALSQWNFGIVSQRLDGENWLLIGKRIATQVAPWVWPFALIGIPAMFRLPVRAALVGLGLLAGSLGTIFVFFNLYRVHDYYLCAVAFPVWLAVGLGLHTVIALIRPLARRPEPAWILVGVGLLGTALLSEYVRYSYQSRSAADVVRFGEFIRTNTPADAEVIVFGEDWNPRIPYYARRKALMVRGGTIDAAFATQYAGRHAVEYLVASRRGRAELFEAFPSAEEIHTLGNYSLFRSGPL